MIKINLNINNNNIEEIYKNYLQAGLIHKHVMKETKNKIKKGASILKLVEFTEKKIEQYGGKCAFPVNISINDHAAHFTPKKDDIIFLGKDLVKIDIGVHVNGYIADGAQTIDLSNNYNSLIKSSNEALKAAIDIVKEGIKLYEIGSIIENTILEHGYNSIKNLMGHGLNKYLAHDEPSIPNFNNNNEQKLLDNQVIAIEPFVTNGDGYVINGKIKNIYSQIKIKPTRLTFIRQVLNQIDQFHGLPFASRWIQLDKANIALNQLEKERIIVGYPVLTEISKGFVSQTEHTMIVHDWGAEVIT